MNSVDLDNAISCFELEIFENPLDPNAYRHLAACYGGLRDYSKGLYYIDQAIALDPTFAGNFIVKSSLLGHLRRNAEAVECLQGARNWYGLVPGLEWNLCLEQLRFGNFDEGWQNYRYRKVGRPYFNRSDLPLPTKGDPNGTLFIYPEQGLGDIIWFSRFLPEVCKHFKKVYLETLSPMVSLLRHQEWIPSNCEVRRDSLDMAIPWDASYMLSMGDMPAFLQVNDFYPYLPYTTNDYVNRVGLYDKGKNIGVCWRGAGGYINDINRSMAMENIKPLVKKGRNLICLTKNPSEVDTPDEAIPLGVVDGAMADAMGTAALIANCDAIVTVDTLIAHLAASLGKETYILLPYNREWRWGENDESITKTPFYGDNVTLVQQKEIDGWEEILDHVSKQL